MTSFIFPCWPPVEVCFFPFGPWLRLMQTSFCPSPQPMGPYRCHLSPLCALLGNRGHIWLLSCGSPGVRGTFGGLCSLLFRYDMQPFLFPSSLDHFGLRELGFCSCLRPYSEIGHRIPYCSWISQMYPELCFSLPGFSPAGGNKA